MLADTTFLINFSIESGGLALCILAIVYLLIGSKAEKKTKNFLSLMISSLAAALISNMVGLIFKGNSNPILFTTVRIANFCEFFFSYTMLFLFGRYLLYSIEYNSANKNTKYKHCLNVIYIFQIVVLVMSQFLNLLYYYDENYTYQRGEYFWLSHVICVLSMAFNAAIYLRNIKVFRKKEKEAFLCYLVFPIAAMTMQTFIYGYFLDLYSAIIAVTIMFVFIVSDQMDRYLEKENENTKMQVEVMLSQIQPHFLYNSIGAISELCKQNPEQARQALQSFADYLRGNMNSVNCPDFIPFTDELSHIEAYLKLEKMRFSDKLNIVYDIEETDFFLPALTVQPIVENAVKHGICKTEDGGTVILKTRREDGKIIIYIIDNGVGFDTQLYEKSSKGHIGIANVKKRLEQTHCGELIISSKQGAGTTAEIIINQDR